MFGHEKPSKALVVYAGLFGVDLDDVGDCLGAMRAENLANLLRAAS